MPQKEIDYSKTHFYKVVCKDVNVKDYYIGHTANFTKRKNKHKTCCVNESNDHYNLRLYKFLRENGGWNNWDMVLINTENHKNRLEVLRREREYIEQYEPSLNSILPHRTEEDEIFYRKTYYQDNKESITEKKRNIQKQSQRTKEITR